MIGWKRKIILVLMLSFFTGCASTGRTPGQGWNMPVVSRALDGLTQMSQTVVQNTEEFLDPNKNPEKTEKERNSIVDTISVLTGFGGGVLCAATIGKKHGRIGVGLCALAGLASQQIISILGKKITQGLKEDEQREVLVAVTESLKSNQPVIIELPDSDVTIDIMPSQNQHTKSITIPIYIDSSLVTSNIPTLNIVGDPFRAKKDSSVYKSATSQSSATKISRNEDIHVIGKTNNSSRMLVSKWLLSEDEGYAVPMAIGFVEEDRLQQSAEQQTDSQIYELSIKKEPDALKVVETRAIVTCKEVDIKRTNSDGNVIRDKAERCFGPDGFPINT